MYSYRTAVFHHFNWRQIIFLNKYAKLYCIFQQAIYRFITIYLLSIVLYNIFFEYYLNEEKLKRLNLFDRMIFGYFITLYKNNANYTGRYKTLYDDEI
jgi:hypothetical protein